MRRLKKVVVKERSKSLTRTQTEQYRLNNATLGELACAAAVQSPGVLCACACTGHCCPTRHTHPRASGHDGLSQCIMYCMMPTASFAAAT
jgi:hypothetical protein